MKLYIKNMACNSCKVVVKETLEKLGAEPKKVELGEVETKNKLSATDLKKFNSMIRKAGLELVVNKEGILLEKIKAAIVEYVYQTEGKIRGSFSQYLSRKLNYSYNHLANFFSTMQASTIEHYIISLKIEKVKELILFHDKTLTQIADELNYSSVAHLSSQFKKETGLTPSHFKALRKKRRIVLQDILKN